VGSPNLTGPAFEQNVELAAEINDLDGSFLSHFDELWESEKSSESFDLIGYQKKWDKEREKRPRFLNREAGITGDVVSPPDVLVQGWDKFLSELKRTKNLEDAVLTIRSGHDFVTRDWKKDLEDRDFKVMMAMKPFAHFGKLTRISKDYFAGNSDEALKQRLTIARALNLVIQEKQLTHETLTGAFDTLCNEVKGCGPALATRLLLFARPDCCVVVNKKSFSYLARKYKVAISNKPTSRQYADLIQAIQHQDWWKTSPPTNPEDYKLWEYRAALTDLFAFKDYEESS
jgi:hypothetical protein